MVSGCGGGEERWFWRENGTGSSRYLTDTLSHSKSCDLWLHGNCVNMTRSTQTALYVCAYCVNAPQAQAQGRGGSSSTGGPGQAAVRRVASQQQLQSGLGGSTAAPLKSSFKAFR